MDKQKLNVGHVAAPLSLVCHGKVIVYQLKTLGLLCFMLWCSHVSVARIFCGMLVLTHRVKEPATGIDSKVVVP
eukprot:6180515-Pleurochrysis_carterae.AAC.1